MSSDCRGKSRVLLAVPKQIPLWVLTKVSFETSFDSKQPKLEPKPVSALSETKRLFRLFRFYTETERFNVSIEPKQTENQTKQFDRENILLFFTENLGFFSVFFCFLSFFFVFFSVCFETVSFSCFASIPKQTVSIEPKQTEDPPKQFEREYIWEFFRKFRVVSVCYEKDLFVSVVSIKVRNTKTNRNFFFLVSRNKPKQTRNISCFGLFRFEPKFISVCFEDTLVLTIEESLGSLSLFPNRFLYEFWLKRKGQGPSRCSPTDISMSSDFRGKSRVLLAVPHQIHQWVLTVEENPGSFSLFPNRFLDEFWRSTCVA